jgi:hypothetical protein
MPVTDRAITAAAAAVGFDTLERLVRLDAHGHPILSVCVDLGPTRFPAPDTRGTELGAVLDGARRQGGEMDADRVHGWLNATSAIGRGARGLAIFSAPAEILEIVALPIPVEPLAVVDTVPWLEPRAAIMSPAVGASRS